ncbi:unnamed protein product [Lactuca saligna]|uniref:K Homology domain-containing protein n=1 Tax=Lactuca saligna TaxID=75948 RepID=A0AA35YKJ1_LACSI|nr:unnamed protein product [Lactuca saligna]
MYRFLNTLSCSYLSLIIPHDFHVQTLSIMKRLQDYGQKPYSTTVVSSAYGYGNPSKNINIPNGRVGVIIDPNSLTRTVELTGTSESIAKAEKLIKDVLAEAESGSSGIVSRRMPGWSYYW